MFDGIKKKTKLFFGREGAEPVELSEISSIELNQTVDSEEMENIRPPGAEEITYTADFPSDAAEAFKKTLHLDCFGRFPYRKDGCNHCNMVNDCIKAKIANNFNRR